MTKCLARGSPPSRNGLAGPVALALQPETGAVVSGFATAVVGGAGSVLVASSPIGGGHLDPEDEQFAVESAIAPVGILPCQAQD